MPAILDRGWTTRNRAEPNPETPNEWGPWIMLETTPLCISAFYNIATLIEKRLTSLTLVDLMLDFCGWINVKSKSDALFEKLKEDMMRDARRKIEERTANR